MQDTKVALSSILSMNVWQLEVMFPAKPWSNGDGNALVVAAAELDCDVEAGGLTVDVVVGGLVVIGTVALEDEEKAPKPPSRSSNKSRPRRCKCRSSSVDNIQALGFFSGTGGAAGSTRMVPVSAKRARAAERFSWPRSMSIIGSTICSSI
jgi:hypothetical protein